MIEGLIRNAAALLGAERCSLFRVEDNELVSSGPGKEGPDTIRVPVGTGICGHVALKGQFVNIPDAYADSRFNQENDRRTGFRTRSLLCCPVFFNGNVIAVVQFINKMHGDEHIPFAENDESLFTVFSSFAGVALSNAYHRNDAACERKKNEFLLEAARQLSVLDAQDEGVHAASKVILHTTKQLVNASVSMLFQVHDGVLVSLHGDNGNGHGTRSGVAARVLETKRTLNIPSAYDDPVFNPDVDETNGVLTRNVLCVPVLSVGGDDVKVVGVIEAVNKRGGGCFSQHDEGLLVGFAQFVALYLRNTSLLGFLRESQECTLKLVDLQNHIGIYNQPLDNVSAITEKQIAAAMSIEVTSAEKEALLNGTLDVHTYKDPPKRERLVPLSAFMFEHLNYLTTFNLPKKKLTRFLLTVESLYREVHYHNFRHAFDVTHSVFLYLTKCGMLEQLSAVDAFSLLVSCLVHDVDHMGLNNSFHTKAETPLGLLSNAAGTTSVLEVRHCNLALEILGKEETGIFDGMRTEDWRTSYKNILSNVLSTDMAKHRLYTDEFVHACQGGYNVEDSEHRRLAAMMLIKCGDLSNITQPFKISRLWAMAVTSEFYEQGDKEKSLGCAVTPNFNRDTKPELAQTQINFIDFVGLPFFSTVSGVFKGMERYVERIKSNRNRWEQVVKPPVPRKSIF